MAYTPLRTDFKDDILDSSNYKRKYKQVVNSDGTFSFQDETTYQQVGSDYGAKEVNEERKAINKIYENKLVTLDDVALVTEEGFFVDALAVKELNSKLANTNTNLAKANTVLENRKPIFIDSTSTGSVTFDTTNFLKSGITYAFVVAVNSNLNSGTYAQEITCKLNDVIIGKNGNYYTLTSIFSGKCSKGDRIHITSYKNGGNWTGWGTRCIFIPLS
jgi:hypothetical protein|nr:MAG TPA: hypothetical protein [Caudoviricetes sp.]